MRLRLALQSAGSLASALLLTSTIASAAPSAPSGFVFENAAPNVAFHTPTAVAFLPSGRMLVAEKRGYVWMVENGVLAPRPLWSADREILDDGDRGLVGIAVDPHFALNRYVYFLYTVDPDSDGVDHETASFGRLTRYQVSATDSGVVDPATRTVLIGASWRDGFPSPSYSHGVACLRWGNDGTLLVSAGEGAHYDRMDAGGLDSLGFLPGQTDSAQDLGGFRSQQLESLAGKVLRIDPATGLGLASNPFAVADLSAPRSRVWAYGLRNPFRFCVRPGTGNSDPAAGAPGTLWVGDVGWNAFEELNVAARGGMNFGWPCHEGRGVQALYAAANPARLGCGSEGTPENPSAASDPTFAWSHTDSTQSVPYGIRGNCTVGGAFYEGSRYPALFHDRLFFADYARGWLRVAAIDSLDHPVLLQDFATGLDGPVDLVFDPVSGDLHYVSIYTGEVRRLRYVGGDDPHLDPIARASAGALVGPAPATIAFSSLGSYDPAGAPITTSWSFGDGDPFGSAAPAPSHVYRTPGIYQAVLAVSNGAAIARDTLKIVITATRDFPANGVLDEFARPDQPLGAPWIGKLDGLAVRNSSLVTSAASNYALWNGAVFSSEQEVFADFDSTDAAATETDLLLKVQGVSWSAGAIQVLYSPSQSLVAVTTYTPGAGWTRRGGPWTIRFQAGDQFAARAYSNGVVTVARNGIPFGTASVRGWDWYASGGRVGVMLVGAGATRIADVGGGNVGTAATPPRARILSPADRSFFVAGQSVVLRAAGATARRAPWSRGIVSMDGGVEPTDDADSLSFRWDLTILHNNHEHPDAYISTAGIDSFRAVNHDDGTGVHNRLRLVATNRAGLSDTATVSLYPEIDLSPSPIGTAPLLPTERDSLWLSFTIRNHGRMPAPFSRWTVLANHTALAIGDTLVPALDSVRVTCRVLAPAAGTWDLRVVVDTLGTVTETREDNNACTSPLTVWGFPTSRVIDAFGGEDGPLTRPWTGAISGLERLGGTLHQTASTSFAIWSGGSFGPAQEVFYRFDAVSPDAPEQDLLLKVQGESWTAGTIQITYHASASAVWVYTYTPVVGWEKRGGPIPVHFGAGDQFGARAFQDGRVRVFRNGSCVGGASVAGWAYAGAGGRVGLLLAGAGASRFAAFGGGDFGSAVVRVVNTETVRAAIPDSLPGHAGPGIVRLSAVYPNPGTHEANLMLELPRPALVSVQLFDLGGRRVWSSEPRTLEAGRRALRWSGSDARGRPVAAGVYLMRVGVGGERFLRTVVLTR